jgi:hypothetical protein
MFEFDYTYEQNSIWLLVSKIVCMVDFVISDFPESGDMGCEGSCSFSLFPMNSPGQTKSAIDMLLVFFLCF